MIRAEWLIAGVGAGRADGETAEDAARAVIAEMRPTLAHMPAEMAANVLGAVLHPMRLQAATDGALALSRGNSWEYRASGVVVTFSVLGE
jgi:hypothetical protein